MGNLFAKDKPSPSPSPPVRPARSPSHSDNLVAGQTISSISSSTRSHVTSKTIINSKSQVRKPLTAKPVSQGPSHVSSTSGSQAPKPSTKRKEHFIYNYVIPAAELGERGSIPQDIILPPQLLLNRHSLRVCPQYNSRRGCTAALCRRLHVCYEWATQYCKRAYCHYSHSFIENYHNISIYRACQTKGVSQEEMLMLLQSNHRLGKKTKGGDMEICMYNILKRCSKESCPNRHSTKSYIWEVRDGAHWIQFSYQQSNYLELQFSDPSQECVDLIPLPQHLANNRELKRLANLLSQNKFWTVDFGTMEMKGDQRQYPVRRVSTPSDLTSSLSTATRWLWYWRDHHGSWKPYTEGSYSKHCHIALSDQLEYHLQIKKMDKFATKNLGIAYIIDGKTMLQTNVQTGEVVRVCRRPTGTLDSQKSVKFDELFLGLPTNCRFMLFPVLPLSSEFTFIEKMMTETLEKLKISSIQRIQNDLLWKSYQNKKNLLVSLYNGNSSMINEQYLFHGTNHTAIDFICRENLDWKLAGYNVGHAFGHGTYFSNTARIANQYSTYNSDGQKIVLVVFVMLGKMTRGHSNMLIPPENPATGRCFDTTCNDISDATIFVKYNRDEYYPAYIVKYTDGS